MKWVLLLKNIGWRRDDSPSYSSAPFKSRKVWSCQQFSIMISGLKKIGVIVASKIANAIAPGQGRRMAERVARWVLIRLKAVFKLKGIVEGSIILWPSPGEASLEQREWLKPGTGQILIKTLYTVVSPGTERAMYNGLYNTQWSYPVCPGGSGSGIVIETARKVKDEKCFLT